MTSGAASTQLDSGLLVPTGASFIGVDLAWKEGANSGLAAFREGAELPRVGLGAADLDSVVQFVLENRGSTTVVAIDAPLIITNAEGMRDCERLVSKKFGYANAGAYPSSLKLYSDARSVELARRLANCGFRHCFPPGALWSAEGNWFFEVYPHPAQVVLFERNSIIRYKKKKGRRASDQRRGLEELRTEIRSRILPVDLFPSKSGLDDFLSRDLNSVRGRALKFYEDSLDAIVCAYLAFHLWQWGWQGSEMFGDLETGYIVVPSMSLPRS
jgi:predicted RNase H-like nuclease